MRVAPRLRDYQLSRLSTINLSAGVAQQRQQQFRKLPGNPPHGSASLPVGPISCSRSSNYQSGRLRTARLPVRFLPGAPSFIGHVVQPE